MQKKILFVSHDANRAGSQLLLLQLLKILKQNGVPMHLLLGRGGVIEEDFKQVLPTTILSPEPVGVIHPLADKVLGKLGLYNQLADSKKKAWKASIREKIEKENIGLVFVNSIANASIYAEVLDFLHDVPVVLFAHELQMSASMYTDPDQLAFLIKKSNHLITVAQAVADYYIQTFQYAAADVSILTLIDSAYIDKRYQHANKNLLQEKYGIPNDAIVIGGCGNAEWRKGNDVFNWIAKQVISQLPSLPVYFVWIGAGEEHEIYPLITSDIARMGLTDRIILVPPTPQALDYISRFDMFLLSSREDPYPLVVLEAALNETPVICFQGAGGAPELIEMDAGRTVPYMDIAGASAAIMQLIVDPQERIELGKKGREKVLERHKTEQSVEKIMTIVQNYLNLPLSETLDQ